MHPRKITRTRARLHVAEKTLDPPLLCGKLTVALGQHLRRLQSRQLPQKHEGNLYGGIVRLRIVQHAAE